MTVTYTLVVINGIFVAIVIAWVVLVLKLKNVPFVTTPTVAPA